MHIAVSALICCTFTFVAKAMWIMWMFWILLRVLCFADLSLAALFSEHKEVCYGKDFSITEVRIKKISFTPLSPRGPQRIVVENETAVDPRYRWDEKTLEVPEVTEKDQGVFTFSRGRGLFDYKSVRLTVKDCSRKLYVHFGDYLRLELHHSAALLEFLPEGSVSQPVTVWEKTEPKKVGERYENQYWSLGSVTGADMGYYTARDANRKFISRTKVILEVKYETSRLSSGDTFSLPLRLPTSQVQLYFTPINDHTKLVLVRNGIVEEDQEEFWARTSVESGEIIIENVKPSDSGDYEIQDKRRNVISVTTLEVEPPPHSKYLPLIALVGVVVLLCICIKRRCCRKKPVQTCAQGQPAAYGEVSAYAHPVPPSVPSQPQWSGMQTNVNPSPASGRYTPVKGNTPRPSPAAGRRPWEEAAGSRPTEVDGGTPKPPTSARMQTPQDPPSVSAQESEGFYPSFPINKDCLRSSDAGIQFEFWKGHQSDDDFSTLPLNEDTSQKCSVYASDKLNFL
ncbi:hypothetical protein MATL_G00198330 [Megalops atlanticus]|uniref:Uncharacterized protein n=1 Tax=Megalops atlanticus TaxID=7932 RepID=A0A9D3PK12_MEGAT|nr:hypothetical protein MATL_G00198330 [Megalops atlanticus]